jgi:hypothetical protein
VKALRTENKSLKEKLENKCLELSNLKMDLENINKEKNILSVTLKASRADTREQRKNLELQKKMVELNDYKKIKLEEERELKIKKRKELKKTNQKLKKEKEKELSTEEDTNKNEINLRPVENMIPEAEDPSEVLEEKPEDNYNFEAGGKPGVSEDLEHTIEEMETRLMSEVEKEEFFKEIQAKVDEALKNLWPG